MIETSAFHPNFSWSGADVSKSEVQWKHVLNNECHQALLNFSQTHKNRQLDSIEIFEELAPTVVFPILSDALCCLKNRFGFAVVKNIPVDLPVEAVGAILMAVGNSLGRLMPQNSQRELITTVTDKSHGNKTVRGYQSNSELPLHSDTADVLALLCLRPAKSGGANTLASSNRIYECIHRDNPNVLSILQRGFRYAYPEEPGDKSDYIPVFSEFDGQRSCRYLRSFIEMASDLTEEEVKALDVFDATAISEECSVSINVEPGDLLLANNYTVLHSRTAFEDHDELTKRRFLLRLWLNVEGFRPLNAQLSNLSRRFCN